MLRAKKKETLEVGVSLTDNHNPLITTDLKGMTKKEKKSLLLVSRFNNGYRAKL